MPIERFGLGAALWRTRRYILPELKHFIVFAVLSGIAMLLELASTLVFFDLLTNKVFLGDPLSDTQASLLGLQPARFVDVETLNEEARFTLRTVFLVVAGALMAIGFLLGTGLGYYLTWILQRVNQHLRLTMMDRAVHLSLRYHDEAPVGDAIYRVYQDSAMVTTVVQNALIQPVTALTNLGIALVAIGFFEPYLGLLFLIAAIPSVLAARAFTPRLRDGSARSRLANSALTSHIQESVNGVRVLKAQQAEDAAFNTFRRRSHRALDHAYELRRRIAVLNLLVFLFTAAAVIGADYLMTQWVWAEAPTFGYGLVAVVGFAVWNLGAFQAARDRNIAIGGVSVALANLWSLLQDIGTGLKRAFFLLDLEPEVQDRPGAKPLPQVREGVSFAHVDFAYRADLPVIRDATFTARVGTVTAIVGASGAGKSTLMSLLLRLYDVDGGEISIDGEDIRNIRVRSLRDGIGIVLQENALFPTSIADNIRFAAPDADDASVRAAAATACADEFIEALPGRYSIQLGERGAKLSTGQRQRISIARAVAKNAPILILDEPTASLDVDTEQDVLERLTEWGRDKVIFLITHRIRTIRQAHQVLFVEHGTVVEQGSHDALMNYPDGRYRAFASRESLAAIDSAHA